MHKIVELRKMLCSELEKITDKGELNASTLEMVDKLTHSIKSIDTIIAMEDYEDDYSHGRDGGYSYRGRGLYAKRDSLGRYSRDEMEYPEYSRDNKHEVIKNLKDLLNETSDNKVRQAIQKALDEMQRG